MTEFYYGTCDRCRSRMETRRLPEEGQPKQDEAEVLFLCRLCWPDEMTYRQGQNRRAGKEVYEIYGYYDEAPTGEPAKEN